ncbi:phosphotransferase [Lishizhenia sp.]|uniref:phosphotransferase n=1 Tax=Lishizhenia sp. TaxID=2497594 RepID=UPI00299D450B|nr:phosphotransferase [Lishizhenia sp.]MDX1446366.1 phosphotransferase [Lishizhenia sp.]
MSEYEYTPVPGRGLLTRKSLDLRLEHLQSKGYKIDQIQKSNINPYDIQKNIESFIGSVEVPLGIGGPLRMNIQGEEQDVYCVAGTLEGALMASMNRGAKAISLAGGVKGKMIHQRMMRAPMFQMNNSEEAAVFEAFVHDNFPQIKEQAESYSNHACLLKLDTVILDEFVTVRFIYTTGDAAGQNMTTTCTWHAIQWINQAFEATTGIEINHYIIEGNGASDKKVSQLLLDQGRGVKVEVECTLSEDIIKKVLRTDVTTIMNFFTPSKKLAAKDGMVGYNVNVANVIAAIFVATGQDLASIHESSTALLETKKVENGIHAKLTLYSLVIGTVGGGTHLPKQRQALELMGCYGTGKIERFATIIAGFCLGLELSTISAIASGEFAKAHEKLGRNKPVDWIQWNELNSDFITAVIRPYLSETPREIELHKGELEKGILMNICRRVTNKLIGFIPLSIETSKGEQKILIKSKAKDIEVIKGLHMMSASIDPKLSDLLSNHKDHLEYVNSHLKELLIPHEIHQLNGDGTPKYFGHILHNQREIFMLFQEFLDANTMHLMDSENKPWLWSKPLTKNVIDVINQIHLLFKNKDSLLEKVAVKQHLIAQTEEVHRCMIDILIMEYGEHYKVLNQFLDELIEGPQTQVHMTLVHNDFNPRNIAIRKNGEPVIYDWELSVIDYPQRDVVEFLSFVLEEDFSADQLMHWIEYHYQISESETSFEDWKNITLLSIKKYIVTRIVFYKTANVVMNLKFVDRIYANAMRMLQILEEN